MYRDAKERTRLALILLPSITLRCNFGNPVFKSEEPKTKGRRGGNFSTLTWRFTPEMIWGLALDMDRSDWRTKRRRPISSIHPPRGMKNICLITNWSFGIRNQVTSKLSDWIEMKWETARRPRTCFKIYPVMLEQFSLAFKWIHLKNFNTA